jgi:hypothetical protein
LYITQPQNENVCSECHQKFTRKSDLIVHFREQHSGKVNIYNFIFTEITITFFFSVYHIAFTSAMSTVPKDVH